MKSQIAHRIQHVVGGFKSSLKANPLVRTALFSVGPKPGVPACFDYGHARKQSGRRAASHVRGGLINPCKRMVLTDKEERSMARPLLREGELRTRVDIYLTAAERDDIAKRASSSRLAVSAFIRKAAMGQRVATVPTGNAKRWESLARLASNLNQVAHHLNAGHAQGCDPHLIEHLLDEVQGLRLELMGAAE